MEQALNEKLLNELRERVSELLAATQLMSGLVREQGDEKDRKCLAVMNHSLYRMLRTIGHMELCREDTPFSPQVVDLAGLCRDLGREMEHQAKELGVRFRWELEQESVLSLADEKLLQSAVLNLLTNAFEAAGPEGHVILKCAADKGRCDISVWDDGPGLKEPAEEKNPFLKEPGGLGLGLPAVRQIARFHGGVLLLENREEGGLRAVLSLPIQAPAFGEKVKTPAVDPFGGFSPLLVELSPLLAARDFSAEDTE